VVEVCIHIANGFYLMSFLVRDMLPLRLLTCAGLVLGIAFFTCRATPLYGPTLWHVVFLLINGVQIRRLVRERRQLRLTAEQERFSAAAFGDLSREELLTLLTHVLHEEPARLREIGPISHRPLSEDERVLRDVALGHLTRAELVNLLTRRFWNSVKRRNPVRWWRRRRDDGGVARGGPEVEMARGSVSG
jgi:Popeye protein conserved region